MYAASQKIEYAVIILATCVYAIQVTIIAFEINVYSIKQLQSIQQTETPKVIYVVYKFVTKLLKLVRS